MPCLPRRGSESRQSLVLLSHPGENQPPVAAALVELLAATQHGNTIANDRAIDNAYSTLPLWAMAIIATSISRCHAPGGQCHRGSDIGPWQALARK